MLSLTTPLCNAESSKWCRCWPPYFIGASTPLARADEWKYLYRAVDRAVNTVDFLLTAKRNLAAVRQFLEPAINLHGVPKKITIGSQHSSH